MEKTITITEGEYRKLVAETTAEIMAEKGEDAPQAALLFSLSCIAFSAALTHKLFPKDEDDKKTQTEPNIEQMRKELDDFCSEGSCETCPVGGLDFECGRGHTFKSPAGDSGYMTDESIVRHYKAMKGAES